MWFFRTKQVEGRIENGRGQLSEDSIAEHVAAIVNQLLVSATRRENLANQPVLEFRSLEAAIMRQFVDATGYRDERTLRIAGKKARKHLPLLAEFLASGRLI